MIAAPCPASVSLSPCSPSPSSSHLSPPPSPVLIIPFRIGFGVDCTHIVAFVFDCLVDIMFFLDIILNFRTAYFDR